MRFIAVTPAVLKPLTFSCCKDSQPLNILDISVTLSVSQLLRSSEVSAEH